MVGHLVVLHHDNRSQYAEQLTNPGQENITVPEQPPHSHDLAIEEVHDIKMAEMTKGSRAAF